MQSHEPNNVADACMARAGALGRAGANAADALGDRTRDVISGLLDLAQIGLDGEMDVEMDWRPIQNPLASPKWSKTCATRF